MKDRVGPLILHASRTEKSVVGLDLNRQDLVAVLDEDLAAALQVQREPNVAVLAAFARFVSPPHRGDALNAIRLAAPMGCGEDDPAARVVDSRHVSAIASSSLVTASHVAPAALLRAVSRLREAGDAVLTRPPLQARTDRQRH